MKSRALLLLLPLLLAGVSVWLVQSAGDTTVPGRTDAATAASGPVAAIATDATAVEATSRGSDADRSAAGTATDQRVPFPDDAFWVEVRVVDKTTGEAVPDATVTWSDQTTQERLGKDASLSQEDRRWLQRDQEQVNLRYGWQAISDRSGLVRVHVTEQTLVLARREARYGTLRLQKNTIPPRDGYRVELEPDLELAVQVLDARGQPAADVPIGVTQHDAQGKLLQLWRWQAQAITRAPDGIAALRHLQEWSAEVHQENTPFAEWRLRTFLPGYDDPGVAFSLEAPAREPVVLRLPPTGGVRVRAELHGALLSEVKTIGLGETRASPDRGGSLNWMMRRASQQRPVDHQGWAHFDHVPLGGTFRATASIMAGYLSSEFKGPMTEETVVTVVLKTAEEQILLAGRLLDEQKTVLADQEFTLVLRAPYSDTNTTFRTDVHGRFLLFLGQWNKDQPLQRVCIVWRPPGRLLQADLSKLPFRSGRQEAGDVVLQTAPLVVAGRLMSGDGPSKAKVQPSVERCEVPEGKSEPRWRRQLDLQFHRDEEGHFEFRGDAPPGRYRLQCSPRHYLPVEPIEFALGAKDVVVNLDPGSPLAASVLLPNDFPGGVRALLVRDGEPTPTGPVSWINDNNRLATYPWTGESGRYQLQWASIAPGTYTLHLQLWCDREPLASIGSVQVPVPQGGDGRLVDIDVRSLVRVATVCLFDQNGQPLQGSHGSVLFPIGQDPEQTWTGWDIQGAKTPILVRANPLDLLVAKRGFRPRQIQCAGATTDAKLDPWPTVELAFDGLPELPPETTLQASFAPRELREAKYRTMSNSGDRNDLMTVPRSNIKVEQGRAKVPIGDGPHDVAVALSRKRRNVDLVMPKAEPVYSNTQGLRVELQAAALQQALDKLTVLEAKK